MKIFEFKFTDNNTDWVYAPSKKKAKKFYKNTTANYFLKDCSIKRIPKKKWKDLIIYDEYYNKNLTFKEWVKKNNYICDIIATTNF